MWSSSLRAYSWQSCKCLSDIIHFLRDSAASLSLSKWSELNHSLVSVMQLMNAGCSRSFIWGLNFLAASSGSGASFTKTMINAFFCEETSLFSIQAQFHTKIVSFNWKATIFRSKIVWAIRLCWLQGAKVCEFCKIWESCLLLLHSYLLWVLQKQLLSSKCAILHTHTWWS